MSFRDLMQKNPAIVGGAAIIVILGCVVWIARGDRATQATDQIYYFDLGSGELFSGERTADPPIDAPSGKNQGVKAAVYACGACDDDTNIIAFLTTYSERAREAIAQRNNAPEDEFNVELDQIIEQGMLVATAPENGEQPNWVPAMTPQGIAITAQTEQLCGDDPAKPCLPK